jgi:chemotaxis protein methyltransferase CheR
MVGDGESLAKNLTPEQFERFRDYIHKHSGIYLEANKTDSLRISLITRATRLGFDTLEQYFDVLISDETEFKELMNLITINETSFFRFPAQFEALRQDIIPELIEAKPETQKSFRVWSAGCSTGEEPYSVAMTLLDSGIEGLGYTTEVLGTDVSTNALDVARTGVYPSRALLSVPHTISSRFFEPTPKGHRVADKVRNIIDFQFHNLIKEPYPLGLMGNWDAIFCRNVTIYFRLESTRRVVNNFYESLNPGGYLFVGHSETLTSISDRFEPVEVGGVFLYRKSRSRRPSFSVVAAEHLSDRKQRRRSQPAEEPATPSRPEGPSRVLPMSGIPEVAPLTGTAAPKEYATSEPAAHVDLAELLGRAREASADGKPEEAIALTAQVLERDSQSAEAYLLSAFAHADVGDLDAALREANEALSIDPLIAAARYTLGIIYLRMDDPMRATTEFKKTIYIDADFPLAHLNLANLYRAKGAIDDACREYENALKALYRSPEGDWTAFLGGFRPDLLAKTCERSLIECRKTS